MRVTGGPVRPRFSGSSCGAPARLTGLDKTYRATIKIERKICGHLCRCPTPLQARHACKHSAAERSTPPTTHCFGSSWKINYMTMEWDRFRQVSDQALQAGPNQQQRQQQQPVTTAPQQALTEAVGATGEQDQQQQSNFGMPQHTDSFPLPLDRDWHDGGLSLLDSFPGGPASSGPSWYDMPFTYTTAKALHTSCRPFW